MSDFWSDHSSTSILYVCEQRRLCRDCADAQALLSLCWSPMWYVCVPFPFEPAHEIMALFVLRKLILQTHMRSHPVGLDVWFLVRTLRLLRYFMRANSKGSGETARMRRLAWAFAGHLCDKYHNLMSWLICFFGQDVEFVCIHSWSLPFYLCCPIRHLVIFKSGSTLECFHFRT